MAINTVKKINASDWQTVAASLQRIRLFLETIGKDYKFERRGKITQVTYIGSKG